MTTCKGCKDKQEKIDRLDKENHHKDLISKQEKEKIEQLKLQNAQEKKKHSEINNEIIRSNVRYQKNISDIQTLNKQLSQDKQQLIDLLTTKDKEIAILKSQNEALTEHSENLLQKIDEKLNQIQTSVNPQKNFQLEEASSQKGSESKLTPNEPKKKSQNTRITKETLGNNTKEQVSVSEKDSSVHNSGRNRSKVSYKEPSLRKKLRKGDERTFGNDEVYLSVETQLDKLKKTPKKFSTNEDKENTLSQQEAFSNKRKVWRDQEPRKLQEIKGI